MGKLMQRASTVVLVAAVALAGATSAFGQDGKPCKDVKRELPQFKSHYFIWVAQKYTKEKPGTLIIFLPNTMYEPQLYMKQMQDIVEPHGLIYCVPKAPVGSWSGRDDKFILGVLEDLKKDYVYDETSVLLVGNSGGGPAALAIASANPGKFTAVAGLAGIYSNLKDLKPAAFKSLPVYLEHGEKSGDFPISQLKNWQKDMEKAGCRVKLVERKDKGDQIPLEQFSNKDLLAWFVDTKAGDAKKYYDEAMAAKQANDFPKAVDCLLKVVNGGGKGEYVEVAKKELASLENLANAALKEGDDLAAAEKFAEAAKQYVTVAKNYPGLEAGKQAAARADEIKKSGKQAKSDHQAQQASAAELAEKAFQQAIEKEKAKDYGAALKLYEEIAGKYAETEFGPRAAAAVEKIKSDPEMSKTLAQAEIRKECEGLMKKADNYRKNGLLDKAAEVWKQVVEKHPDSEWGKQAKELLTKYKK